VKRNTDFWLQKIAHNRARDMQATTHLVERGWTVLRYWEHDTAENIADAIRSEVKSVRNTRA
jgi:DNA mismatch endonuclease (patch repair protein)